MNDDRIRQAYERLHDQAHAESDTRSALNTATESSGPTYRIALAAAAAVIALVVGTVFFLRSPEGDDAIADTTSTTMSETTTTSETTDTTEAGATTTTTASAGPVVPGDTVIELLPADTENDVLYVEYDFASDTSSFFTANGTMYPTEVSGRVQRAVSDLAGGVVYQPEAGGLWHAPTGREPVQFRGDARLVDVVATSDGPMAVGTIWDEGQGGTEVVGFLLEGPVEIDLFEDAFGGEIVEASIGGGTLAVLGTDGSGCRGIATVPLDAGTLADATRQPEVCGFTTSGYPQHLALSATGDRLAVVEAVSLGEIEFTGASLAVYDLPSWDEWRRVEIDKDADIQVTSLDFRFDDAMVGLDRTWVEQVLFMPEAIVERLDIEVDVDGARYAPAVERVATHRVANVETDDVLNVRHEPDPSGLLFAELAPTYAGVAWTGETATAADGGTWWRVELVDPVRLFNLGEPLHGGAALGWVNAAFLEPIAVGLPIDFDRLACESGGGIGAVPLGAGGIGDFPADHVYSLAHGSDGSCHRVVITLGSDFSFDLHDRIENDIRPADEIPAGFLSNEEGMVIGLGPLTGARFEAAQVATPTGPVLVARDEAGDLVVEFSFDVTGPQVRTFPEEGRIVVDYVPAGESPDTTDRLVVVRTTFGHSPGTVGGSGSTVFVQGWARPFEATLGIELTKGGAPIEADFSGSNFLGDVTDSRYAVMTTDWSTAWGQFSFGIGGLAPGEYELFLSSDGAGEPIGIVVPVVVEG